MSERAGATGKRQKVLTLGGGLWVTQLGFFLLLVFCIAKLVVSAIRVIKIAMRRMRKG